MAHLSRLISAPLKWHQYRNPSRCIMARNYTANPFHPSIPKMIPRRAKRQLIKPKVAILKADPSYPNLRDPDAILPYPNALGGTFQSLYEFLSFTEIRTIFWAFEVTKADFIKALMAPSVSSRLDRFLHRRQTYATNNNGYKLSSKEIIRWLRVDLWPDRDLPMLRVKNLLKCNDYIKRYGDPDGRFKELPLDHLDGEEDDCDADEYVLADRYKIRDVSEASSSFLFEPLVSLLLGRPTGAICEEDDILNEYVYWRNLESKKSWQDEDYEQALEKSMEAWIKKREEIEADVIISGPYMFRKPPVK